MNENHYRGLELIRRGVHCGRTQQLEDGVLCLVEGLSLLDEREHPRLVLSAFHNLALYLAHLGLTILARSIIARSAPLYQRLGEPLMNARLRWLRGTVAQLSGDYKLSAEELRHAVDAFVAQKRHEQAAQVQEELTAVREKIKQAEAA